MSFVSRFKTGSLTSLFLAAILAGCGGTSNNPANPNGKGPAPVSLGSATDLGASGSYVLMAKTAISNVTGSPVTGNVGLGPKFGGREGLRGQLRGSHSSQPDHRHRQHGDRVHRRRRTRVARLQ